MRPAPLVALAIDGPAPGLLARWVAEGRLPVLARLQAQSAQARVRHVKRFRNERCWDLLLQGRDPGRPGSTFDPARYRYHNDSMQRDTEAPLFYALGPGRRVAMFDLPAPLSPQVHGIQVSGWASELNSSTGLSSPPDLLPALKARFGSDPKLVRSGVVRDPVTGELELSYRLPNLYDAGELRAFGEQLVRAVHTRTDILCELLRRERWDLFLGCYVESHSANHSLWHLSQAHPLHGVAAPDLLLAVHEAIDAGLGAVLAAVPPGCRTMVYTIDATAANAMDLPTMALLPELAYRWNFPGQTALPGVEAAVAPAPGQHWKEALWAQVSPQARPLLESPQQQQDAGDALSWNPANWYRPLWPRMKAFALPSVADGYLRVNVRGREARGVVEPQHFGGVLDELSALLLEARDTASGQPLVERVLRMREQPGDAAHLPPDLLVCWRGDGCAQGLDSATLGRIGPLPYFRSGGHLAHGSEIENPCWVTGPDIVPGSRWRDGLLQDVPATMLALIGAEPPPGMTGRPLMSA